MNISFYNGVSGLIAYQEDLNAISHNMANINTAGYKGTNTSFQDLLYTEMDINREDRPLTGHGVRVAGLDLDVSQGSPRQTNRPLDLAILGEGFFAVERNGQVEYTRNGVFSISVEGKNGYLVSALDGGYILDQKGKRIKLTKEGSTFDVENLTEKVGVYLFDNPYGLERTDSSSFLETDRSGAPHVVRKGREDAPYLLKQSAVESSNVELTDAMGQLIVTQKAYQMNAKMVKTADELEEIINNLR